MYIYVCVRVYWYKERFAKVRIAPRHETVLIPGPLGAQLMKPTNEQGKGLRINNGLCVWISQQRDGGKNLGVAKIARVSASCLWNCRRSEGSGLWTTPPLRELGDPILSTVYAPKFNDLRWSKFLKRRTQKKYHVMRAVSVIKISTRQTHTPRKAWDTNSVVPWIRHSSSVLSVARLFCWALIAKL